MLTATYTYVALQVPRSLHLKRIMLVSVYSGISLLIASLGGGALATFIGMKWLSALCVSFLTIPTALVFLYFKDIGTRTSWWFAKPGEKASVSKSGGNRASRTA